MKLDLRNLLRKSAAELQEGEGMCPGYAFSLREVAQHLDEVAAGLAKVDEKPLREWLELYCIATNA